MGAKKKEQITDRVHMLRPRNRHEDNRQEPDDLAGKDEK